jgi:hypothetical protein
MTDMPTNMNPRNTNPEVLKFIDFKANTLKRAASGEITTHMANILIQPELGRAITASRLTKKDFLQELLDQTANRYNK